MFLCLIYGFSTHPGIGYASLALLVFESLVTTTCLVPVLEFLFQSLPPIIAPIQHPCFILIHAIIVIPVSMHVSSALSLRLKAQFSNGKPMTCVPGLGFAQGCRGVVLVEAVFGQGLKDGRTTAVGTYAVVAWCGHWWVLGMSWQQRLVRVGFLYCVDSTAAREVSEEMWKGEKLKGR